jgi:hypothetical protein
MNYTFVIVVPRRTLMPNLSDPTPTTRFRPIPLITIYAFGSLSALTVSFALRQGEVARTLLLTVGLLFAAIATACFVRFLWAADESLQAINYRALVFGFITSLGFVLVLDFLRSLGFRVPIVPVFGIPASMIILWTVGLVLAAGWQRFSEGREE